MRSLSISAAVTLAAACLAVSAGPAAALERGRMIVYKSGQPVPESELSDLGPPSDLGGTVISGDPRISARIDYADNGALGGVFEATRGTVLIHFPFTEHATIIAGEVRLGDEYGNDVTLRRGDSYLIHQGTDVLWDVRGARVQKSFFNRTQDTDTPAPMTIYRAHDEAPGSELADLGDPEALGGTVVSGDPRISARVDEAFGPWLAGVFQATRGDVQIDFPFTEHATVLSHDVTLTDETGNRQRLDVGDSYLIARHSQILWQVHAPRVQKSFLNVAEG